MIRTFFIDTETVMYDHATSWRDHGIHHDIVRPYAWHPVDIFGEDVTIPYTTLFSPIVRVDNVAYMLETQQRFRWVLLNRNMKKNILKRERDYRQWNNFSDIITVKNEKDIELCLTVHRSLYISGDDILARHKHYLKYEGSLRSLIENLID